MQLNIRPTWFVAVGPFCWGRARTLDEAIDAARPNLPRQLRRKRVEWTVFASTGGLTVAPGVGVRVEAEPGEVLIELVVTK